METGTRIAPYSDKQVIGTVTATVNPPRTTGVFHPYPVVTANFGSGPARFYDNAFLRECIVEPDGELRRDKILRRLGLRA